MTKPIITPIAEVADRYTIARLKAERLDASEVDLLEMQRQVEYYQNGLDLSDPALSALVNDLYAINAQVWDAEHEIRKGQDETVGFDEIGRRALRVRDLNRLRVKAKNDITELTGDGFKDCKMNYCA